MKKGKCRGCGKEIIWGENADTGRPVPLDPTPPVYHVVELPNGKVMAHRDKHSMVTHFATCPDANKFSGRGKND